MPEHAMTPVRIRWTFSNPGRPDEIQFCEAEYGDWLAACQCIAQVQLYDNLVLAGITTADMEGFRHYASRLEPYGIRWYPEVEVAMNLPLPASS